MAHRHDSPYCDSLKKLTWPTHHDKCKQCRAGPAPLVKYAHLFTFQLASCVSFPSLAIHTSTCTTVRTIEPCNLSQYPDVTARVRVGIRTHYREVRYTWIQRTTYNSFRILQNMLVLLQWHFCLDIITFPLSVNTTGIEIESPTCLYGFVSKGIWHRGLQDTLYLCSLDC